MKVKAKLVRAADLDKAKFKQVINKLNDTIGDIDPAFRDVIDWFEKNGSPEQAKIVRDAAAKTMRSIHDAHSKYWYKNKNLVKVASDPMFYM